ncbi:Uncharacterised protein [Staphylococcus aureus]|uniref:Uncharacterized protein n=1 Tax=Staphylococcus aureus TaxID=1280 RepID=A0A380DTN1_STAAU|nr:Uncharacterised protein [Staphylococcus aureus]
MYKGSYKQQILYHKLVFAEKTEYIKPTTILAKNVFIFVSTIFCKYERNPNSTTNAIRICPIRMCVIGTDKPVDCNKIKLSANVLKLYIPIIRIIKGKIKASNRRSITFRLIENFKPASWTFLYLKTSIQMIAAIMVLDL